jgi:hypothetical protein
MRDRQSLPTKQYPNKQQHVRKSGQFNCSSSLCGASAPEFEQQLTLNVLFEVII